MTASWRSKKSVFKGSLKGSPRTEGVLRFPIQRFARKDTHINASHNASLFFPTLMGKLQRYVWVSGECFLFDAVKLSPFFTASHKEGSSPRTMPLFAWVTAQEWLYVEMACIRGKLYCAGNITSSGLRGKENIRGIGGLTLFFLTSVLKKLNCTGFRYLAWTFQIASALPDQTADTLLPLHRVKNPCKGERQRMVRTIGFITNKG